MLDQDAHLAPNSRNYVGQYDFKEERFVKIFLFVFLVVLCLISIAGIGLAGFQIYNKKAFFGTFPLVILCPLILGVSIYEAWYLHSLYITNVYAKCKFVPCSGSMLIRIDWQCSWCGNQQGKERWIFERCLYCKRYLDYFVCEHCKNKHKIV